MQSDRHLSNSNHHAGKRPSDSLNPPAPLLPADTEDSQLTLSLKHYLKQQDIEQIWEAYRFGEAAHRGQMRKSGEPYITHPVSVAIILSRLHLGYEFGFQLAYQMDQIKWCVMTDSRLLLE